MRITVLCTDSYGKRAHTHFTTQLWKFYIQMSFSNALTYVNGCCNNMEPTKLSFHISCVRIKRDSNAMGFSTAMCSQPFHGTRMHAPICAVDILNSFLCKHMQISMFIFAIKLIFVHRIWHHTFLSKTVDHKGTVLCSFFIYSKRWVWLCRVWTVLMGHPVYKLHCLLQNCFLSYYSSLDTQTVSRNVFSPTALLIQFDIVLVNSNELKFG